MTWKRRWSILAILVAVQAGIVMYYQGYLTASPAPPRAQDAEKAPPPKEADDQKKKPAESKSEPPAEPPVIVDQKEEQKSTAEPPLAKDVVTVPAPKEPAKLPDLDNVASPVGPPAPDKADAVSPLIPPPVVVPVAGKPTVAIPQPEPEKKEPAKAPASPTVGQETPKGQYDDVPMPPGVGGPSSWAEFVTGQQSKAGQSVPPSKPSPGATVKPTAEQGQSGPPSTGFYPSGRPQYPLPPTPQHPLSRELASLEEAAAGTAPSQPPQGAAVKPTAAQVPASAPSTPAVPPVQPFGDLEKGANPAAVPATYPPPPQPGPVPPSPQPGPARTATAPAPSAQPLQDMRCPWVLRVEIVKGRTLLTASTGKEVQFRVSCDRLELIAPNGRILAAGNVAMSSEGLDGRCEQLTIAWQEDRVVLEGQAEVTCLREGQEVDMKASQLSLRLSASRAEELRHTRTQEGRPAPATRPAPAFLDNINPAHHQNDDKNPKQGQK